MVEEHAEDAAPVQNTIEFHQLQYLAAWLAMKRQTDQCSPNLDPPCLTAVRKENRNRQRHSREDHPR
jgi:hypothetical protein